MERSRFGTIAAATLAAIVLVPAFVSTAGAQRLSDWSEPVNLGSLVNSVGADERPALSFDGSRLYFGSTRPGSAGDFDLYVSTRTKLTGRHDDE